MPSYWCTFARIPKISPRFSIFSRRIIVRCTRMYPVAAGTCVWRRKSFVQCICSCIYTIAISLQWLKMQTATDEDKRRLRRRRRNAHWRCQSVRVGIAFRFCVCLPMLPVLDRKIICIPRRISHHFQYTTEQWPVFASRNTILQNARCAIRLDGGTGESMHLIKTARSQDEKCTRRWLGSTDWTLHRLISCTKSHQVIAAERSSANGSMGEICPRNRRSKCGQRTLVHFDLSR